MKAIDCAAFCCAFIAGLNNVIRYWRRFSIRRRRLCRALFDSVTWQQLSDNMGARNHHRMHRSRYFSPLILPGRTQHSSMTYQMNAIDVSTVMPDLAAPPNWSRICRTSAFFVAQHSRPERMARITSDVLHRNHGGASTWPGNPDSESSGSESPNRKSSAVTNAGRNARDGKTPTGLTGTWRKVIGSKRR